MQEFEIELAKGNKQEQLNELGDLLFAVVNVARLLEIHPEEALQWLTKSFFVAFRTWKRKYMRAGII